MKGWSYFALVQLVSIFAMVIGWGVLIPFCLFKAWAPTDSIEVGRKIDRWTFAPLNSIYGNREDGVSGSCALVWNSTGTSRVPYRPNAWAPWRAYVWSGWRNSADNLKYLFAWKNGPFYRWSNSKFFFQAGWNASGFPVLSIGRI